MNKQNKYLIVKGAGGGGLGDRIRCVLTGLAYAILTQRCLFIDWSDARLVPEKRNVFYDLFNFHDVNFTNTSPQSTDVFPDVWHGNLSQSLHEMYEQRYPNGWNRHTAITEFSINLNKLDYPQNVILMWEFDQLEKLLKPYSMENGMELMRKMATDHLSFNAQITDQVEKFKNHYFKSHDKAIAVHIRATDEFSMQKDSVHFDQYCSQIKHFTKQAGNTAKVFLATDNQSIVERLTNEFPGRVITRDKWFAEPGEKLHFNEQCPQPDKALYDALVEMCLLSSFDYLIYQHNSSFGVAAHTLSKAGDHCIAPLQPKIELKEKLKRRISQLMNKDF